MVDDESIGKQEKKNKDTEEGGTTCLTNIWTFFLQKKIL
jgi:hypothetical protein